MRSRGPLILNLLLGSFLGCANIAGVGDYKQEGEDGKALNADCTAIAECGSGLTCVSGSCLRKCYDLANPSKQCGANACVPLVSLTEAVCFPGGGGHGGHPCTVLGDCAAGFNCVEFDAGGGGHCAPYCTEGGSECGGDTECRAFANRIVIDGKQFGICGPATSTTSGGGGNASPP